MTPPAQPGQPGPALRPGDQLASTACSTRVVVIRVPDGAPPPLACGGQPMVPAAAAPRAAPGPEPAVTLIGKRYVDAAGSLELLCTCSGAGELSSDGEPLTIRAAKPLPASD
jgi:hypothetical protein